MFKAVRKLYDWCLVQAETKHAERALFLIAVAESSFFPVPPDVLLIAMVIANREKWLRYFLICLAGSVFGGVVGYFIGYAFWQSVDQFFLGHIFSEELFIKTQELYQAHDFWIVFVAGFTPIPYKVFTITAGVAEINVLSFILASLFGRGGRFILVAGLLRLFGAPMKEFLEKYFNILTLVFAALLIGGFVAIKYLLH